MTSPMVSSALKAVELRQIPPPMIIGERVNTQGSRAAKRLVLEDDYDGLVDLARTQVEDGAHCLDICVATTERPDELEFMTRLVKRISLEVDAPLVIDSTDPEVIESAVRQTPGRPIINSINLEGDGTRFKKLAPLMAKYGVPAIALCIGPDGMAKTPQQKLDTAELLYETGKKYGLKPEQFIFDVLTFTLATGEAEFLDAGRHTLDGIRAVKERFPESYTVLGLSNISFGLAPHARKILNSVFLYHAVQAGLDCAIVNAREIVPYGEINEHEKRLTEDLIFNKSPDALSSMVAYFEKASPQQGTEKKTDIDPSWSAGKRSKFRITNRLRDGIESDVVTAIAEKISKSDSLTDTDGALVLDEPREITHDGAIRTLNEDLLPAMKEVGDKFGAGEIILPFVLKSAECMKAAVSELEKYLLKGGEDSVKGRLVLGTVYGDVHDIGKNLVKTIFENNGYAVYDLGKQVPLQKFLDKIEEVKPDAVGMSALLVSTSKQMHLFVEHARKNSLDIPILCGGAAVNSNYINRIAKDGGIYESGMFYCNTMFDGLKTMDGLISNKTEIIAEWRQRLENWKETASTSTSSSARTQRSDVRPISKPPTPPSTNVQIRLDSHDIPLDDIWKLIDKKSLFKLSWGLRGKAGKASEAEHEMLMEDWRVRIKDEHLFEPSAVYGYFRCHGSENKLIVESPDGDVIFDFPRSSKSRHLCLADYFGDNDIVAFQSVTVGCKVSKIIDEWNLENKYTDAYYLHGLAVEAAEALAVWINQKIKSELGLNSGCLRYSWGYPSCPDISQHELVWKLLDPQKSDMTLTSSGQIVPEQSTAAIVVHHPDAEYFG